MCIHLLKEQEPTFTIKNKKSRLKVKLSLSGGMSFNLTAMAACMTMNSARCQVLDNFFQISLLSVVFGRARPIQGRTLFFVLPLIF